MSDQGGESGKPAPDALDPESLDMAQLLDACMDKPINVDSMEVVEEPKPLRTRSYLIQKELDRICEAETLEEMFQAMNDANERWQRLDIFQQVGFHLDEAQPGSSDVKVQVVLVEKRPVNGRVGTFMQGGEGSMEAGVGLRNVLGTAEHLNLRMEYGNRHSNHYSLSYKQPYLLNIPATAEFKLHQYFKNQQEYSSYTEEMRGAGVALTSISGRHQLGYDIGWRRVVDPTSMASKAVLQQAGDYLKSVLQYTFIVDHRDSAVAPRDGWAFRSQSSLAGLFPGANHHNLKHWRQQLDWLWASRVSDNVSFNFSGTLGLLVPWGEGALTKPTCICDRFLLGGPSTLRGFSLYGAGPTDLRRPRAARTSTADSSTGPPGRDTLGGDLYASVMAGFTFDLPGAALKALNIQGHCFINGGNVVSVAGRPDGHASAVQEFGRTFRWAAGVGLVLPTWFGKLEANLVRVVAQQELDRAKHGLQIGFASSPFV